MTKSKHKSNKAVKRGLIRGVHIQAILFLVVYNILSKYIFIKSVIHADILVNFIAPYVFGVVAGIVFLYLLDHEDFFHFMKEVEKEEKKKENLYLKKYLHYGKVACVLIIALIGGPVFSALTIRFLLNKFKYGYLLIALGNIGSTLLTVSIARGALSLVF